MTRDNDTNDDHASDEEDDSAQDFDQRSFNEPARRLEPVFEDLDTLRSLEDSPQDTAENLFEDTLYNSDYDEDTIDYDVNVDSLLEDAPFDEPSEEDNATVWPTEGLKPELMREPGATQTSGAGIPPEGTEGGHDETLYHNQAGEIADEATLPMSLIAIAVIALLLLGAGGYGVMQQRAAMQEEIRVLQARIATSSGPDETAASREERRNLEQHNAELTATVAELQMEMRAIKDTAAGLESQLAERQVSAETESVQAPAPTPEKISKPAPKPPAQAKVTPPVSSDNGTGGNWFVNFSSYSNKNTANTWAARLKPSSGKVIVAAGEKNGATFYRVRVVGLKSKEQAQATARVLEQEYDLSQLWVGTQ
jgi:cell division septation protein DedD